MKEEHIKNVSFVNNLNHSSQGNLVFQIWKQNKIEQLSTKITRLWYFSTYDKKIKYWQYQNSAENY